MFFPLTLYALQSRGKNEKFADNVIKYSLNEDKNNNITVLHQDVIVNQKISKLNPIYQKNYHLRKTEDIVIIFISML